MADGNRGEPEFLVVGHVSKTHGTKGEVFVMPLSDRMDEVFVPGRELAVEPSDDPEDVEFEDEFVIEAVRAFKSGVLVKFEGVETKEDADLLARRYLMIPASAAAPLEEGEVFYHQLIGLAVVTTDGQRVGSVQQIYENGPMQLLEVRTGKGKPVLLPFTEPLVKHVDVEGGRLVIEPMPGLLEQ